MSRRHSGWGATFHSTEEILSDLNRIAAKTRDPVSLAKINRVKQLVQIDAEIVFRGNAPPSVVKGPTSMALTRSLQGVQIIGFTMTAVNMTQAAQQSVRTNSVRPITAETVRQVGGWGVAWAGMKLGAAGGALVGIKTGPGAVITGAVGSVVGGVAGYFGFDWIADHISEN